ncbi:hypothetical protein SEA_REINDEER_151 [Mycobacterium phage Reindeer]|uniref:Uncharacterized protein n=1 Tax=Mycobacterium phage Reindeer TaxID=2762283 RepID=A0A7G8LI70_9CAUD|nr:hypothetical protein J4U05_gp101 [Mycobacterium phage Reindeer]QNJ56942.1 hypothetical protein SEA_REINDEER_151 [Mycobacterium phage Reindeer]
MHVDGMTLGELYQWESDLERQLARATDGTPLYEQIAWDLGDVKAAISQLR